MTTSAVGYAGPDEEGRPHYHPIGITFHWLMAGLVLAQLWWGWFISMMPAGYDKLEAYASHAFIGVAILLLAFMRAGWRLIAPFVLPDLEKPEDMPGWQHFAAEATHFGLYVLMFAMPLSGWLMLSAHAPGGVIALPAGLTWPPLPLVDRLSYVGRAHLEQTAETIHFVLAWAMMGLVAMHVGASFKHHFIDRDDVLARMIPPLGRFGERP